MNQNEYKTELVTSIAEATALRDSWQALPDDPNGDLDFYLAVVRARSEVLRPHVIVLRRAGAVSSILAGRLERSPLRMSLGYAKVASPPVRLLTLVHGGVLGGHSPEDAAALVEAVQQSLREGHADVAWFHGVDCGSTFHEAARKAGTTITRDRFPTPVQRWRLKLPGTYQELLRQRSANTRHNLKRYSKRLRDAFGDRVAARTFRDPSEIETLLSDTEQVACKTYHRGLGVGFVADSLTRSLATLAAEHGWLRAHILYVDNKPCAFWNGFLYRGTFFTWTTAFDPALGELRPGMFLLQKCLEDLCNEGEAKEVDFGFGDAQYKRDWCDHEKLQTSFFLFAPTIKGVALNALRTPLLAASETARSLLAKTGTLARVKRLWRARTEAKAAAPEKAC